MNVHTIDDELAPRTPIDRVAARVTQIGERYVPNKRIKTLHLESPPPTIPIPPTAVQLTDCTGRRCGNLTVIGLCPKGAYGSKKYAMWICRCDCGKYTARRTRAILNPNNADKCDECRHLDYLKRDDYRRRTGRQPL